MKRCTHGLASSFVTPIIICVVTKITLCLSGGTIINPEIICFAHSVMQSISRSACVCQCFCVRAERYTAKGPATRGMLDNSSVSIEKLNVYSSLCVYV